SAPLPLRSLRLRAGLAFSPDGRFLVSGAASGDLRVWDGQFGRAKALQLVLDGHDLGVAGVDFSPCPANPPPVARLASGARVQTRRRALLHCGHWGSDNLVKIWQLICFEAASATSAASGPPTAGSGDHTVRIWKPETASSLHVVEAHAPTSPAAASPVTVADLPAAPNDRLVRVWDLAIEELPDSADTGQQVGEDAASDCWQFLLLQLQLLAAAANSCCGVGGCSGGGAAEVSEFAGTAATAAAATAAAAATSGRESSPRCPPGLRPSRSCRLPRYPPGRVDEVARLLEGLGLRELLPAFRRDRVDGSALLSLTDGGCATSWVSIPADTNCCCGSRCRPQETPESRGLTARPAHRAAEPPSTQFVCPVTREVMLDPVIAADGHTYERSAIETWFASGR
uniref:U-box domain-containing protein n=1 Tax=Macrostomum lignano TaxID=282301 RepID=A0A1I8FTJ6_9PLAT